LSSSVQKNKSKNKVERAEREQDLIVEKINYHLKMVTDKSMPYAISITHSHTQKL